MRIGSYIFSDEQYLGEYGDSINPSRWNEIKVEKSGTYMILILHIGEVYFKGTSKNWFSSTWRVITIKTRACMQTQICCFLCWPYITYLCKNHLCHYIKPDFSTQLNIYIKFKKNVSIVSFMNTMLSKHNIWETLYKVLYKSSTG